MSDTITYLNEIRKRLIASIFVFLLGTIISFINVDIISQFLRKPAGNLTLIYVTPPEALMAYIRLAVLSGFILSMPIIIYQVVAFIYPALYKSERKIIIPIILFSMLLFALGMSFAYYIVYPFAIGFFLKFAADDLHPYFTITAFLSFMSSMIFSFGLVFQMPCIFFLLGRIHVLSPSFLKKNRKYAILVILIAAAIITPPDVVSQALMSVPLFILYEVGIVFVKISQLGKKSNQE